MIGLEPKNLNGFPDYPDKAGQSKTPHSYLPKLRSGHVDDITLFNLPTRTGLSPPAQPLCGLYPATIIFIAEYFQKTSGLLYTR
ncbi:MAG TPA: hypothetical protein DEQ14_06240 [Treponema sp.]|nr:hypothetical protein [Treponema sp.]